jgi:hypothetical protein
MKTLNRFEKIAKRITTKWGVHCEWTPANREYVVDTRVHTSSADKANVAARKIASQRNAWTD